MARQLYAAVIRQPDMGDGYFRGIMAFVTHDVINIVANAASLECQADLDQWAFLVLPDEGTVSVLDIRLGGMIRGQKPLTQPFSSPLRDQLADYRGSLLGGMRSSDSREQVELANSRAHSAVQDEMIDLQAARDAATPDATAEAKTDKKRKSG